MSTTIPYGPSLVLGNIVPDGHLSVLNDIADLQTPIDAAQDELNSAILLKRKLMMTMQELVSMKIDTSDVAKSVDGVNSEIMAQQATSQAKSFTLLSGATVRSQTGMRSVVASRTSRRSRVITGQDGSSAFPTRPDLVASRNRLRSKA